MSWFVFVFVFLVCNVWHDLLEKYALYIFIEEKYGYLVVSIWSLGLGSEMNKVGDMFDLGFVIS